MSKPPRKPDEDPFESPWLRGTGVRPTVSPGRRLDTSDRRINRWSASGVRGVVPPGAASIERQKTSLRRRSSPPKTSPRPVAGFQPDVFNDRLDPDDLGAFLGALNRFIRSHKPQLERAENFRELIVQSQAPFEIVVGFTILSSIVGSNPDLRRRFATALERGAKVFFNLAKRLHPKSTTVPEDLAPESVDAIFHDLPDLALEIPFAFAVQAFCEQLELLAEGDQERDRQLLLEAKDLRSRFIERRAYGDRALRDMFLWSAPFQIED